MIGWLVFAVTVFYGPLGEARETRQNAGAQVTESTEAGLVEHGHYTN
jgi:hypothetical protein